MDRFARGLVVAAALALVVAGCGGGGGGDGGEAAEEPECVALEPARLDDIGDGLKGNQGTVTAGQAVELPADEQDFGFTHLAAVEVEGRDEPVVLALQDVDEGGISVVDDAGALVFDWGTAATQESPMGEYQASLVGSSSYDDALSCLEED